MAKTSEKMIANNKKAYHDYFILEKYEAGISLAGTEVKSLRMGKCSIKESFIRIENGEVYIYGMHISPYEKSNEKSNFNRNRMRYDDGAVLRMRNKSNTGESAPRHGEKRGRNKVCYGECENEHGDDG